MISLEQVTRLSPYHGKPATSLAARAISSAIGNRCMSALERIDARRPDVLRVLTYHRIRDTDAFEQQMQYLAGGYHIVSMSELLSAYQGRHTLPPRSVMITFDDAYENFARCAWPVLRRLRLPVTMFVPTAYPDQPARLFWWDRLEHALRYTRRRDKLETPAGLISLTAASGRTRGYRRLRDYVKSLPHAQVLARVDEICRAFDAPESEHCVLSWDALRQLADEGVTLCAHTRTHPLLNRVSIAEARDEAVGSLLDLEREIGAVLPVFAYPDGRVNDGVVEALKQAGFVLAFTTVRGTNDLRNADRLRLRRINIGERATVPVLRARLLQATPYLNRWQS